MVNPPLCGIIIGNDTRALQSDRCQKDQCECADCLGLTPKMYQALLADQDCCLRWFCEDCDRRIMDTGQNSAAEFENTYFTFFSDLKNMTFYVF